MSVLISPKWNIALFFFSYHICFALFSTTIHTTHQAQGTNIDKITIQLQLPLRQLKHSHVQIYRYEQC